MVKMTIRKIKLDIDWVIKNDETVDEVAKTFHVSSRRIEQLVKLKRNINEGKKGAEKISEKISGLYNNILFLTSPLFSLLPSAQGQKSHRHFPRQRKE